jgi:hypothetical protein
MAGLNYRTGKVTSAHHSKFPFRSDGNFPETILTGGISHIGKDGIGDCSSALRPCYLGFLFILFRQSFVYRESGTLVSVMPF